MRASPGPGAVAGRDALRRQADHRRGDRAGSDAGRRRARSRNGTPPGCSIASADCCFWNSPSRSRRTSWDATVSLLDSLLSEQFSNVTSLRLMEHAATLDLEDFEDSELQDRLERARRQASGRMTLIGQLFGQVAGPGDDRQLRRRTARVRAVADRAAGGRAGAGVHRRGALQRAKLFAQLRAHRRAARNRLRPADRRERRDREGSQDLRAQPLSDRSLPASSPATSIWRTGSSRCAAPAGAVCWPPWARSRTTSPTPTSSGAPCTASSRSAI